MLLMIAPAAKGVTHAFRMQAKMQLLTAFAAKDVTHVFRIRAAFAAKCCL